MQLKTEEIHKLQRKQSEATASSLDTEAYENECALSKLMESMSRIKLELIEVAGKKARSMAEHNRIESEMESLKSKLVSLPKYWIVWNFAITHILSFHRPI